MFWEFVLRLFLESLVLLSDLSESIGQRKPDLGHIFLFLWAVPLL